MSFDQNRGRSDRSLHKLRNEACTGFGSISAKKSVEGGDRTAASTTRHPAVGLSHQGAQRLASAIPTARGKVCRIATTGNHHHILRCKCPLPKA